jgi:hypothetical protein
MLFLLTSCGGGGGGSNSIQNISQPLVSVFVNSPAKGISFNTSSGLSGVTNANGEFNYRVGDVVEFSLELGGDKVVIGSTTFNSVQAETSVLTLTGTGINSLAVSQVLQTLDIGTLVGKMDFTGLTLPADTRSNIKEALVSTAAASSRVANIASDLQSNGYTPKNGVSGVNTAEAIARLSTQTANQQYLKDLVAAIPEDTTPLSLIFDKTYFIIEEAYNVGVVEPRYKFGTIFSNGTYKFAEPDDSYEGSYIVSNDGKSGFWTDLEFRTGTYRIKIGDSSNYYLESFQGDNSFHTFITGSLLSNLSVDHFFNKTITVVNGCSSGVDAIYTIDSVGAWANSCGSVGKFKDIVNATPGADSSQYCNAGNGGFLRIIPNTVCFENHTNHTNDTNSIVAISKGTLNGSNGSGVIIRILNKIENKEFETWNFSY